MKTIITLLTTAVLAIGATGIVTSASAEEQGSNEAPNYALSWQAARGGTKGFGGYAAARSGNFGAYASAREGRQIRNGAFNIPGNPGMHDFQLDGR